MVKKKNKKNKELKTANIQLGLVILLLGLNLFIIKPMILQMSDTIKITYVIMLGLLMIVAIIKTRESLVLIGKSWSGN